MNQFLLTLLFLTAIASPEGIYRIAVGTNCVGQYDGHELKLPLKFDGNNVEIVGDVLADGKTNSGRLVPNRVHPRFDSYRGLTLQSPLFGNKATTAGNGLKDNEARLLVERELTGADDSGAETGKGEVVLEYIGDDESLTKLTFSCG